MNVNEGFWYVRSCLSEISRGKQASEESALLLAFLAPLVRDDDMSSGKKGNGPEQLFKQWI